MTPASATSMPGLSARPAGGVSAREAAFLAARQGGWRVWAAADLAPGEAIAVIGDLPRGEGRHYLEREVGGEAAFVKVYNRRGKHGLIRRFRPGRSVREAAGYRAFARAGIETPRLLMWGEERRLRLFERGVIVTRRVDAPTVAEAVAGGAGTEVLLGAARALARIHVERLAHGDPRTRNFLATSPEPMPFDLCSWGRFTFRTRRWDLIQFLGSALALTKHGDIVPELMDEYQKEMGRRLSDQMETARVMSGAIDYARREGAP